VEPAARIFTAGQREVTLSQMITKEDVTSWQFLFRDMALRSLAERY
jgi:hypothetical protein